MKSVQTVPDRAQRWVACIVGVSLFCAWLATEAATLDTQLVASGLSQPVYSTSPLADGRLFVVEKAGRIKVVQGGVSSTFLTIPVASSNEQGLLGLAFDPGYGNPAAAGYRRFYVNYIDPANGDTVVASYLRSATNASLTDTTSRIEIMRVDQPNGRTNHKAGWIGFKPGDLDNLFVAVGDGGDGNDPDNFAQNRNNLLGKMLRINVRRDDFADPNINYGVPTDNPFVGQAGTRGEIYALGLRNPWRNSFDRQTGAFLIADVGQGSREEINFISGASRGGQNFGWRIREGDIATPGVSDAPLAGLTDPMLAYNRNFGSSITGGYVVREAGSALFGRYVFGDFISGNIWSVAADGGPKTMADAIDITALLDAGAGGVLGNIASFGEGASGELYIVDYGGKVVVVVSEPTTVLMMMAGVALLLVTRRRNLLRQ